MHLLKLMAIRTLFELSTQPNEEKEDGCVTGFLEERLNVGRSQKEDYKFGFGLTVGEQMRRKRSPGLTSTGDGDSFLKTVYSVEFEYSNNRIEPIPLRKEEVFLSS
ncbi:hypothetical protein H5410_029764 [Solanum commersonii]|uniref:Uncharacterized protein n=1 Tax=Solanum commersonii TaxID=4109 RepID=A0A9J5YDU3_SOLCO|nr:hypothetical protein H5410_029764 [Solanum commersonii]